jgi:hypothetical protein
LDRIHDEQIESTGHGLVGVTDRDELITVFGERTERSIGDEARPGFEVAFR